MDDDPEIVISDDDNGAWVPPPGKRKAHAAKPAAKRARPERDRSGQKRDAAASLSGRPLRIADAGRPDNAHRRFWYSDGTLVIDVDDMLFNVYRGRMTERSEYLAERLRGEPDSGTKAQPLHLDNTTADDFEELLDLLERSLTIDEETKPATVLAAITRAATALECQDQAVWAWKCLVELWPREPDVLSPRPTCEEVLECILLMRSEHPLWPSGAPILLPQAYYELIRAGPETWGQKLRIRLPGDTEFAMKTELPLEIKRALSAARDDVQAAWLACLQEGACMDCPDGLQGCGGESAVQRKKLAWFDLVIPSRKMAAGITDCMQAIKVLRGTKWQEHGWCEKCVARNEKVWSGKSKMIWDMMASLSRM